MERTLVLLKPDTLQRGVVGRLIARFEGRGLQMTALKLMRVPRQTAERQYTEHRGKEFFDSLIAFITSGPVVAMVLEGPNAVAVVRALVGATDPARAAAGTIRGDLGLEMLRNLVHGSDSVERAASEIALFFQPEEILQWERGASRWIWE